MIDESEVLRQVFAEPSQPDRAAWEALEHRLSAVVAAEVAPRRRRGGKLPIRIPRVIVPGAAATALLVIAGVLGVTLLQQRPAGTRPATSPAWRLAGTLSAPGFKGASSPEGNASDAAVTCPAPGVCYVVSLGDAGFTDPNSANNVYLTADGGVSWRHPALPNGVLAVTRFSCVTATVCIAGAGLRDASSGPDGKPGADPELLITADGGADWSTMPVPAPTIPRPDGLGYPDYTGTSDINDVVCFSANSCLLGLSYLTPPPNGANPYSYGQGAMVMRTDDAGAHWTSTVLPGIPANVTGVNQTMLSCPSPQSCIAAGGYVPLSGKPNLVPRVWSTDDGGSTWSLGSLPAGLVNSPDEAPSCADTSHCRLLGFQGLGTHARAAVLQSADGGRTWSVGSGPAATSSGEWDALDCPTSLICWVGGGNGTRAHAAGGRALFTQDGGKTWGLGTLPPSMGVGLGGVAFVNALSCAGGTFCMALATPAASSQFAAIEQVLTLSLPQSS